MSGNYLVAKPIYTGSARDLCLRRFLSTSLFLVLSGLYPGIYNPCRAEQDNLAALASLVNRGNALMARRRFPEAMALYEEAKKLDPNNSTVRLNIAECHNNWAILYFQQHQYDKALESLKTVLSMYPNHKAALRNMDIVHQAMDRETAVDPGLPPITGQGGAGGRGAPELTKEPAQSSPVGAKAPLQATTGADSAKGAQSAKGGGEPGSEQDGGVKILNLPPSSQKASIWGTATNESGGSFGRVGNSAPIEGLAPAAVLVSPVASPGLNSSVISPAANNQPVPLANDSSPPNKSNSLDQRSSKGGAPDAFEEGAASEPVPPASEPTPPASEPAPPASEPASPGSEPAPPLLVSPAAHSQKDKSPDEGLRPAQHKESKPVRPKEVDEDRSHSNSGGDSLGDSLSQLEMKVHGKVFTDQPVIKRIEKLELDTGAKIRAGSLRERVENLKKVVGY